MAWATHEEAMERFHDTTFDAVEIEDFERYGFTFRTKDRFGPDEDGYQRVTVVQIFRDGQRVEQHFDHREGFADANSYMNVAFECALTTLEERLAPFGPEWQREQDEERRGAYA